jgi:hypothetical protein
MFIVPSNQSNRRSIIQMRFTYTDGFHGVGGSLAKVAAHIMLLKHQSIDGGGREMR